MKPSTNDSNVFFQNLAHDHPVISKLMDKNEPYGKLHLKLHQPLSLDFQPPKEKIENKTPVSFLIPLNSIRFFRDSHLLKVGHTSCEEF